MIIACLLAGQLMLSEIEQSFTDRALLALVTALES